MSHDKESKAVKGLVNIEFGEEFSPGIAFGFQRVPFVNEIRSAHLRSIDGETKIRCRGPRHRLPRGAGQWIRLLKMQEMLSNLSRRVRH